MKTISSFIGTAVATVPGEGFASPSGWSTWILLGLRTSRMIPPMGNPAKIATTTKKAHFKRLSSLEFPRRGQVLVTVLLAFQVSVLRRQRIAPRILATPFSLGRFLPLGLRRKTLARPLAIGDRIRSRHPHRSQRRVEDLRYIVIKDRHEGLASLGGPDEPVILGLRDLILIDVKGGEVDLVLRCFVIVAISTSHLEGAFRDFNHLASVIPHNRFIGAEVRGCSRDGLGLLGRGGGLRQELLVLRRLAGQDHHAHHHQKKRSERGDDPDHQPFFLHRGFSPSEGDGSFAWDSLDCLRSSMSIPNCTPRKPPIAPPEAAPRGTAPIPAINHASPPPKRAPHTMLTKNRRPPSSPIRKPNATPTALAMTRLAVVPQ